MPDSGQHTPCRQTLIRLIAALLSRSRIAALLAAFCLHALQACKRAVTQRSFALPSRRELIDMLRASFAHVRRLLRFWRLRALRSTRTRPLRAATIAGLLAVLLVSCLGGIVTLLPRLDRRADDVPAEYLCALRRDRRRRATRRVRHATAQWSAARRRHAARQGSRFLGYAADPPRAPGVGRPTPLRRR